MWSFLLHVYVLSKGEELLHMYRMSLQASLFTYCNVPACRVYEEKQIAVLSVRFYFTMSSSIENPRGNACGITLILHRNMDLFHN